MLETSAADLDKRERKKKKKNPDTGFAGQIQIFQCFKVIFFFNLRIGIYTV